MSKEVKFCMLILSHGRAESVRTVRTLKNAGYTGDYYIVIDHDDKQRKLYEENYKGKVITFDKADVEGTFDKGDNFNEKNVVVYKRNATFGLAEEMGYTHFMMLDDDYTAFGYRFSSKGKFKHTSLRNLDLVIEKSITFFEQAGLTCLSFAQGGDYIGGKNSALGKAIYPKRKAMNTMLCSVDRPFQYTGTVNEDVNAYVSYASKGKLFMMLNHISVEQGQTQANEGGLTDIYLQQGTYVKSFYSILFSPSSVKVAKMGNKNMRLHHRVSWKHTTPYIIEEKYKK